MSEVQDGYVNSDIGVIPDDWRCAELRNNTTKVGSGITPTGGARVYREQGRPFIRSQNVAWGELDLAELAFITEETHSTFAGTEIRERDVLLNITGASIGRAAMADARVVGGNVNQHVCIIRTTEASVDPTFLKFFLISVKGQRQIDSFQAGGNRQGLNFEQIRSFKLALPPTVNEQQAIAAALGDADALIAALEALIAKKRDVKQGAMQELLTGQRRLPGFEGEWVNKKLGEITSIIMGQSPPSSSYNLGGAGLPLIQGAADIRNRRTIRRVFTTSPAKIAEARSILITVRAPVGEVSITDFQVCLGRGVCAISYQTGFLYHALVGLEPSWSRMSKGSTFTSVTGDDVRAFEVAMPPTESEQRAIASVLSDLDAEIAALDAKLAKARAVKQGMMQVLLTGEVRLV